ncbi:MAG: flagellin [Pseudomonadota bacterium]
MEFGFRQESARPAAVDQQQTLNRRLAQLNDALGSGLAADPVADAGGRTARLTEAEARDSLDAALLVQHDAAERLAKSGQVALGAVSEGLDALAEVLILTTEGAQPGTDTVRDRATETLADMATLMNTSVGRDFVFAGATSTTPPIDTAALDTLTTAISAYVPTSDPLNEQFDAFLTANAPLVDAVFAGSATPRATITGPLGEITPDALTTESLATEQAFTAVLRPLFIGLKADSTTPGETTAALQQAAAGLKTAAEGQIEGQARLGAFEARLERSATFLETRRDLLLEERRDALVADPLETSVELFQAQSQLEASIDALARILSLDISERLR